MKLCDHVGPDTPLYLHAKCHPEAATWAVLRGMILTIICKECEKEVCTFDVEGGPYRGE